MKHCMKLIFTSVQLSFRIISIRTYYYQIPPDLLLTLRDQHNGIPYVLKPRNQPQANHEIAVIICEQNIAEGEPRSVIIRQNGGEDDELISNMSKHYEPLQYTLLFPHGTAGWRATYGRPPSLTQIQHYHVRLLQDKTRFHNLGKISGEYLANMYSGTGDKRISFICKGRQNQTVTLAFLQQEGGTPFHLVLPHT